ncbi:MAG: transcription antitermination factor NusB [Planctomycetota bacterium]|nr:transcription antitermination factor NusB [Planctomycetota bacterium]
MATSHDHTLAREATLRMLYQIDLRKVVDPEEIQKLVEHCLEEADMKSATSPKVVGRYMRKLAFGVLAARTEVDTLIKKVAQNWDIKRMAIIDRNVIRIGAYEILKNPDIPRAVAINEAIELARKYSTEESGTFVNGILDQMR